MSLTRTRNFASDNTAGICPEALEAMLEANTGHSSAYGTDHYTREVCDLFRDLFETDCEVFFTFNGTAANSLALAQMCQPYHSVICHELAHVETDECGAPEFYSGGSKILTVDGGDGKVSPECVEEMTHRRSDLHYPKPRVLSMTQSTEVGTVYKPDEIKELGAICHGLGLKVHMDGARFANAVAHLGCQPKDITWKAGVDALCFGGTKNGLAVGESLLFFNKGLAEDFEYRCKQAGQLCSKMRFLSAPWLGMLKDDVWLKYGKHANQCARRLDTGMREIGLKVLYPVESNGVFVEMPKRLMAGLHVRGWQFYDFIAAGGCRLMCSWDTSDEEIDRILADAREIIESGEDKSGEVEVARH